MANEQAERGRDTKKWDREKGGKMFTFLHFYSSPRGDIVCCASHVLFFFLLCVKAEMDVFLSGPFLL